MAYKFGNKYILLPNLYFLATVFRAIFAQYFYRECKTDNKNALKNAIFGTKVIHHEKVPKRHRRDSP